MRIRSIRPEFWSSEDVASLDWSDRLVFIGLWSYVDDNGVGRDVERLIVTSLFPLDPDLTEASVRVHRALNTLKSGGQITRYTVGGKPYLHVTAFLAHQKINRPSEGRYPLPTCGDTPSGAPLSEDSVSPHADAPFGEGEKGRRGEDKNPPARSASALAADELVGRWTDSSDRPPPSAVTSVIWTNVERMFGEGIAADDIQGGLDLWLDKGLAPSTYPSCVLEHQRGGKKRRPPRATPTDRMASIAQMTAGLSLGDDQPKAVGRAS